MADGLESARSRRNWIEKIGSFIPGFKGYIEREMRREVDKMQRDWIAAQVDRGRQELQGKIRDWSRSGNLSNLDLASSLDKLLDRFANRIRHADYGYTGFFDAVKIGEEQLELIYQHDLQLIETAAGLGQRIQGLPSTAGEDELRAVLAAVESADRAFDERATMFEDVTQKGAW